MANEPDDANVIPGDGPGAGYVTPRGIAGLAAYLLVLTLAIIWQLHVWWPSCDPNAPAPAVTDKASQATNQDASSTGASRNSANAAAKAQQQTPPAETATNPATTVTITSVTPKSGDVAGSTQVEIVGDLFLANPVPTVTFGGAPANNVQRNSATSITAKTPPHAEGAVDVVVTNSDKTTGTLKGGYLYASCTGLCRSHLLVLVLLAGALGACFHALRSLWMFVGNRSLKQSWVLMYLCLPFNGAVLAFIFFFIISAGSGFFAEPKGSNTCSWIIGIAALVGLFSQQAAEKLKTIADSLFTTVPPKADSLQAAISVTSVDPPQGPVAGLKGVRVNGNGFTSQCTVAFGEAAGTNLQLVSPSSLVVDAPAATQAGAVDVTVTDTSSKAKGVKPKGFTYQ